MQYKIQQAHIVAQCNTLNRIRQKQHEPEYAHMQLSVQANNRTWIQSTSTGKETPFF